MRRIPRIRTLAEAQLLMERANQLEAALEHETNPRRQAKLEHQLGILEEQFQSYIPEPGETA